MTIGRPACANPAPASASSAKHTVFTIDLPTEGGVSSEDQTTGCLGRVVSGAMEESKRRRPSGTTEGPQPGVRASDDATIGGVLTTNPRGHCRVVLRT